MIGKTTIKSNIFIVALLILAVFFANITDTQAAKKKKKTKTTKVTRKYNTEASKKISLDILKQNEELACMANLAPTLDGKEVTLDENNQIVGEKGEELEELVREDDFTYDAENFQMMWMSLTDDEHTAAGISKSELLTTALDLLGTPYRFGGVTKKGLDCSAFTRYIYYQVAGIVLPRTAREQIAHGKVIKKMADLQFGDLVFFHTYSQRFASHVGIYLQDGLFFHSGTRYGVAIASLNSTYYTKRFIGGRRLTEKDIEKLKVDKPEDESTAFKSAM
jgi:cell wall-associated NlpC family hydrolase